MVGHQDFGQQCAGDRINRAGCAIHFARECLAGQFGKGQNRLIVRLDHLAVSLRQADIDSQRIGPSQAENLPGGPRRDERARVHGPDGDNAGERSGQLLEVGHFLQALHIGLFRLHVRFAGVPRRHFHVGILLGNRVALAQILPALGGNAGNFQVGVGLGQRGVRLFEFLVQFRGFDFRQF